MKNLMWLHDAPPGADGGYYGLNIARYIPMNEWDEYLKQVPQEHQHRAGAFLAAMKQRKKGQGDLRV